jgi:CheY-like chemotaxis protein
MQQVLKKVLIIDDDSTAQKFISKAIDDGDDVETISDGE